VRKLYHGLVALALGLAFAPATLAAALVLFEDGRHLHVSDFEVQGEDVALRFEGGGSMTIPLELVSRIVDDEVDHTPPAAPVPPPGPEPDRKPSRSVRTADRPKKLSATPYDAYILAAAKEHRIDPALIVAVIRAESNFSPYAVSRKGARGLMQLMPATARRLGVRRIFDPRENIRAGTAYLAELAERFGETSVDLIAAAYNAGENAVDEYDGVPPYRETREYVRRVTRLWSAVYEDVPPAPSAPRPAG
jgi:soluble lytic murein transglycosylase-like protein